MAAVRCLQRLACSSKPSARPWLPGSTPFTFTRKAPATMYSTEARPQRLIIGISGASGAVYGVRLLEHLRDTPIETHLVVSKSALITVSHETGLSLSDLKSMASVTYSNKDIGASIASGSYKTLGMIVAPCSMRS